MKTGKRLLAAVLIVLMVICTNVQVAFVVTAASGTCGSNLTWKIDSSGTLTISGKGQMKDFDAWDANYGNETTWRNHIGSVKKIVIGKGITSIGNGAFSDATKVTSVTIPGSVRQIGESAFYYCCSLSRINIPEGVKTIKFFAFGDCDSLATIYLPKSLTTIERGAFFAFTVGGEYLKDPQVYYAGSKDQWKKVSGHDDLDYLSKVHFNSTPKAEAVAPSTSSIALNKTALSIYKDQQETLKASVTGKSSKVTWESSNTKIATVSNGKITGKTPGSCTITATANGKKATCKVTVLKSTVTLNKTSTQIYKDGTRMLTVTVKGASKKVKWTSSNANIATVDSKGMITAKKAGTCSVTATANGVSATCKVTVLNPTIELNKTSIQLYENMKETLTATVRGASSKVKWTSTNYDVADVNQKGIITALSEGTSVITAKANGVSARCTVTVKSPTLTISKTKLKMYPGMQIKLTAEAKGAKKEVRWNSLTRSYVSVDNRGLVTALTTGTGYVQASANGISKECKVVIIDPYIKLEKSSITLYTTEKATLKVKEIFGPSKDVTWKSNDKSIANVSQTGVITAKKAGTCTIKAKTEGASTACKITVKTLPTYTIKYYLDGGVNSPKNPKTYTPLTETIVLQEPTKKNCRFMGWKDKDGNTRKEISKGTKKNIELTAIWYKYRGLTPGEAEAMYQRSEKINIYAWPEKCDCIGCYFVRNDGCTWYAASRYKEIYGNDCPLTFYGDNRNAGNWHNVIDGNIFSITPMNDDGSNIVAGAIAESDCEDTHYFSNYPNYTDPGGMFVGAGSGHVCFIEAVDDKNGWVYFTQGSFGRDASHYGYMIKVTVDEFVREYEYIIEPKID